jgi:TusA-related sulfurtransferase/uncharacterized OsmC-like protein
MAGAISATTSERNDLPKSGITTCKQEPHKYDAGDLGCGDGLPQEFRRQVNSIPPGHILEVTTRDPSAKEDLPSLARLLGHEIISVRTADNGDTVVVVRRAAPGQALSETTTKKRVLNQLNIDEVEHYAKVARETPEKCSISRKLEAEWVGGTRSRIHSGSKELFMGGDQDFGAMSVALASLLGCEIDLIATQASVRGIELESLSIEGTGDFNLARYLGGTTNGPSPGYENVKYIVRIKSKKATEEQLQDLVKLCETSSPVGDTFSRAVHLSLEVVIEK